MSMAVRVRLVTRSVRPVRDIVATLVHALRARGGGRGIASLCIGGGEATAIAVERITH